MGVTMATAYLAPVHPLRSGPLPPPPHPPPSPGSQTRRGHPRSRLRLPRLRGPGLWSSALKLSAHAKQSAETHVSSTSRRGCARLRFPLVTFTRDFLFLRGPSMQSVAMPWKSSSSSLSSSSSSSQPCRNGILSSTEPPRRSLELSLPAFLQMQQDIILNYEKCEQAVFKTRTQKSLRGGHFGKFLLYTFLAQLASEARNP